MALAVTLVDNGVDVSDGVCVGIVIVNGIGVDVVDNCFIYKVEM